MEDTILTEKRNPASINIDTMPSREIVEIINNEDQFVADAVRATLDDVAKAVDMISNSFLEGGSLLYFGAGTSGRLGILDASEIPPTFSAPVDMVRGYIAGGDKALRFAIEGAEDSFETGEEALINSGANPKDVVVGISASGAAAYVQGVLSKARALGVPTVAISCHCESLLKEHADVFICPEVGPEVITGSTRLKAGTAQKMVLNMLTTASMVRIGKTYENYMIDVSPTNLKLKDRAVRIVSEIVDIEYAEAEMHLKNSFYKVKPAVVMAITGISLHEAEDLLNKNGGRLREALKSV